MNIQVENNLCAFDLSRKFMNNILIGDKFKINDCEYLVKSTGKYKSEKIPDKVFKTVTIRDLKNNCNIKFYYMFQYFTGNPNSYSRKSDLKQQNLFSDIEGILIVDVLNQNNKLHNFSDVFKIATR